MKTFKKQYYDDTATTTPAIRRNRARGFNDIFGELIERCLGAKSNTKLVELGVGGGGSHEFWHDCTTDSNIYGVDFPENIEDWPEDERHEYKNCAKHLDNVYNIAVPKWKSNPRMHYIPGNTCKEQCALDLIDYTNGEKFNVIINDSIQTGFRYRHLEWLDWYSNILTDDGIILWGAVEGYYKKMHQPGDRIFKRPLGRINADNIHYENDTYTEWRDDNSKISEGEWKDGKPNGKWTFWYANGQKHAEGYAKDGKEDGQWAVWYENGKLMKEPPSDGFITVGETHPFVDGWVVLDLDEYVDHKLLEEIVKISAENGSTWGKPHSYLWVWAHNFSLYKDILNKYKIVSGKELLDENN